MRTQREEYYKRLKEAIMVEVNEIRAVPIKERDEFVRGMMLAYTIALKTMVDVKEQLDEQP